MGRNAKTAPDKMSAPKKATAREAGDAEAFLASLQHPRKTEILALRRIILAADPAIADGVKWNSLSFRTADWFATVHLRAKDGVQLILHLGARHKDNTARLAIPDPRNLLQWLADDRATVRFADLNDVGAKRAAFAQVVRQWIRHVSA